ncbi:Galactokinase [Eumeta japonica]|uniref:Galactokinase n=1 Tax=Eumeta variegata TaxID=151549 RepID=A0A4C1VL71_EUMVA|nr:Galactokinase [Eumeta japonica]
MADETSRLLSAAYDKYVGAFRRRAAAAASAPGRVNLVGDHVDYCDGLVLPVKVRHVESALCQFRISQLQKCILQSFYFASVGFEPFTLVRWFLDCQRPSLLMSIQYPGSIA